MVSAQVTELARIGQTPGGAGFQINYDPGSKHLIVGCGTSIWVYDTHDTANIHVIAKRPLSGLINETDVYGDILFVAATHDGVYALDGTSDSLTVLAHYSMRNMGDSAAYDMWRSNDTLYIADNFRVRMLKYTHGGGFHHITSFGGPTAFCVSKRGNFIAVGNQGSLLTSGNISVYASGNLGTPLAQWSSTWVNVVQDIQFADLRDDIIYVCAGPEDLFLTKSNFFALQLNGSNLTVLDTFHLTGGITGFAQLNIMNMDSRNDTIFLVTTAAFDASTFPLSYLAVIDASGLPSDTMEKIGYVIPGLWHFDAALMTGTPYLAMSSEWLGFLISDVSHLLPDDTLGLFATGGWCVNNHIRGDTLWACHEGYGLVAYKIDSLKFGQGYDTHSKLLHFFDIRNHYFVYDFEFLNDTLLAINASHVFNLKPWFNGGEPQLLYKMNKFAMLMMKNIFTNAGQRMVATFDNIIGAKWVALFNPFDSVNHCPDLFVDSTFSDASALAVSNDTVYYGKKIGSKYFLLAAKAFNNQLVLIDTIQTADAVRSISVENGLIAAACAKTFYWYEWSGNTLVQKGKLFDWFQTAQSITVKNKILYVGDKFKGLKVYEINPSNLAILKAKAFGTGGWKNLYGSGPITIGNDGAIYMSDFHAGVIIYEAYDHTLSILDHQPCQNDLILFVYPNPASGQFTVELKGSFFSELSITDILGKEIMKVNCDKLSKLSVYHHEWPSGLYLIHVRDKMGFVRTGKVIVQ